MKIIFGLLAILGYIANINNYKLMSYILWIISNTAWGLYSFIQTEYELTIMFMVYNVFCLYGIIKEIRSNNNNKIYDI